MPKTIQESKKLKNDLRKKMQNKDSTPEDRKLFGQSVRYHNHLLKEQRKNDEINSRKHQEKMYNDNFWEFSRKLSRGELDQPMKKPTFTKATADEYYPKMYSNPPVFNPSDLNWFPFLKTPTTPTPFNMSPIKPKDIKNILSNKKSTSAPGLDGITYGVLRRLPSAHHFLATLYSKILLDSPTPPDLWQNSNVSLIYKRNETENPKNFRMIALTSVIGKLYHQIISDRTLDFLILNGYLDPAVQKAFIKNINGTIEHNQLLQETLSHARRNNKTIHVTFFDLKDAFGSISHSLISHVLDRYKLPENVKSYINNLYNGINGTVLGSGWKSERFMFKRGVFQGDPLSPTIFIMVFNPLLEYLHTERKHGYYLDKNNSIISTPFADDFNVITTNARTHQRILRNVEMFAATMNLCLEPRKCKSLSICSGRSKVVEFQLSDMKIESIINSPEKFLGSHITYSGKQSEIYKYVESGISEIMENINNSLIRNEYKVRVYQQYVIPALRFKLTVHELTLTNLQKLDALTDRYLKSWLAMPPSGTLAVVHSNEGLGIKSLTHIYKESHAISHATSRLKADHTVNVALDSRVARERLWVRKGSISTYSEDQFQQVTYDSDQLYLENPANHSQIEHVKKTIKTNIATEFKQMWHNHIKDLVVQGKYLELMSIEENHISWKSVMFNLPRGVLQFAVNATIDTLATNANLKRWGKRSNAKCGLCGKRETLHHTLNHCEVMLDRYLWRHNSILSHLYSIISNSAPDNVSVYVDLPYKHHGASTIPLDITVTKQKPDLVLVNRNDKTLIIVELSVPFETNIDNTHKLKVDRYQDLICDIEDAGYNVEYFPFELGSRGFISKDNEARLKQLLRKTSNAKYNQVKQTLCKIVIISSYVIFHSKYEDSWMNPAYVSV